MDVIKQNKHTAKIEAESADSASIFNFIAIPHYSNSRFSLHWESGCFHFIFFTFSRRAEKLRRSHFLTVGPRKIPLF